MRVMAGAATLGELAGAIPIRADVQAEARTEVRNEVRAEEAAVIAELKAGSEEAYAWLVGQFQQPVYSLVYRILNDPADAPDTTQEVFLKIFRGIKNFHGESSLKTWIYRIAVHEASNRRRWWSRHKSKEVAIESVESAAENGGFHSGCVSEELLADDGNSPFDNAVSSEIKAHVKEALRRVSEPYRSTLILRDLEQLSYEEISEVTGTSLGTVKSRLTRGREALKKHLAKYLEEAGPSLGLKKADSPAETNPAPQRKLYRTAGELR